MSRRAFVTTGASLPLAFGLGGNEAVAETSARAKSVLFVWLWGAPSHLDTIDPKPEAPAEYRGPFTTIETRTPGMRFTELLPRLANRSDKFCVVRSHRTYDGGHPGAGTIGVTGFKENPEPVHPNFGSILSKYRGQVGDLPPFFYVGRGIPRDLPRRIKGYGGGKLGKQYDPFLVNCNDLGEVQIPALELLDGLSPDRLGDRRSLLTSLDGTRRDLDAAGIEEWNRTYRNAYGLLTNPEARNAFDLSRESDETRSRYGYTAFGQSALLARRLIETRVPYVQLNWSEYVEAMSPGCDFGWDTHIYNFELLQDRHCPILDRAFSALLDDLDERGLLEETLVVAMGEFGRTPRINNRAARDHWPRCYSSIWAGAGITPGRVIGASNKTAEDPATTPYDPLAVGTTIAHLAGMDTQALAELNVLPDGRPIPELVDG